GQVARGSICGVATRHGLGERRFDASSKFHNLVLTIGDCLGFALKGGYRGLGVRHAHIEAAALAAPRLDNPVALQHPNSLAQYGPGDAVAIDDLGFGADAIARSETFHPDLSQKHAHEHLGGLAATPEEDPSNVHFVIEALSTDQRLAG